MEVAQQKRPITITIGTIVLINVLFCGISIFIPGYVLEGFIAIIVLTIAIGIPVRQKRITLYSFFLFAVSLVFIASTAISYGYVNAIEPLPILQQMEFSKVLQPKEISRGLMNIGLGISYIALFMWVKPTSFFKKYKFYVLFMFLVSILFLLIGIDSVIKGSSRL